MTPHDRRIVHMALKDRTEVVTRSEGDEPRRRIIVEPADRTWARRAPLHRFHVKPARRRSASSTAPPHGRRARPARSPGAWWRCSTGSPSSRRTSPPSRPSDEGIDRHLPTASPACRCPRLAGAGACVDLGSGGGFPGLALAAARPELAVTLVESERRKADWLRRASAGLP